MKKVLWIALCVALFVMSGCAPSETIPLPSASPVATPTQAAETPSPTPTALPTPVPFADGPSIFDADDRLEVFDSTQGRHYDPKQSVPPSDDPYRAGVEAEAIALCDRLLEMRCQSINNQALADLSPLYDTGNETRRLDCDFNTMWMYSEMKAHDGVVMTYEGSTYDFRWDEWDAVRDNGILVLHAKTEFTADYGYVEAYGEEVTTTEGGKDFRVHTDEFAVTRVDGELRLIRYRAFVPNYYGLQSRVIENPGYMEDMDSLRAYIDGVYPD